MDRFTIVGVLSAVQQEFDIGQTKAALLQTVFLVSYMALSPIVGYLGKFLGLVWAFRFGIPIGTRFDRSKTKYLW